MSDEKMSAMERALDALRECNTGDHELDHISAEYALLLYLDETGAKELAEAYRELSKDFWYA